MISFALLNEEIGKGCSSVRSLITVHSMVQYAILKWGSEAQKECWLPEMVSGSKLGAFALSEPEVGSDRLSLRRFTVRKSRSDRGLRRGRTMGHYAHSAPQLTRTATISCSS